MDDSVNPVSREELWQRAVSDLTRAAKLTRPGPAGPEPADFPEFVTTVLAAVAANVGSVDRVLTGRPGSWEAHGVEQLLRGAVGYGDQELLRYRTDPIEVYLNVDQLVDDTGCLITYAEAQERLPWPGETVVRDGEPVLGIGAIEQQWDQFDNESAKLTTDYRLAYERYADRFKHAAAQAAASIPELCDVEGKLRVPVIVHKNTDPDGAYDDFDNPTEWEHGDTIEWRVWDQARQAAGWPTLQESVAQVTEVIPTACAPSRARIVEDREPPASPGSPNLGGPTR